MAEGYADLGLTSPQRSAELAEVDVDDVDSLLPSWASVGSIYASSISFWRALGLDKGTQWKGPLLVLLLAVGLSGGAEAWTTWASKLLWSLVMTSPLTFATAVLVVIVVLTTILVFLCCFHEGGSRFPRSPAQLQARGANLLSRFRSVSSIRGSPPEQGATGLCNLQNTCYMNSTLQCLSAVRELKDYFVSSGYIGDINLQNRDGTRGDIAHAYATLMRHLWSADFTAVAPTAFHSTFGRYAERFATPDQQDNQEFLVALLDALHEDLNQGEKVSSPQHANASSAAAAQDAVADNGTDAGGAAAGAGAIVSRTSDGRDSGVAGGATRPANEIAEAMSAWQEYTQRHRSIITRLFQGQQVCRTICPTPGCGYVARNYEAVMYLSLPLPAAMKTWRLRVVGPRCQWWPSPSGDHAAEVEQAFWRDSFPLVARFGVMLPQPSTVATMRKTLLNAVISYANRLRASSGNRSGGKGKAKGEAASTPSPSTAAASSVTSDSIPLDVCICLLSQGMIQVLPDRTSTRLLASDRLVAYLVPKVPQHPPPSPQAASSSATDPSSPATQPRAWRWMPILHRIRLWHPDPSAAYMRHPLTHHDAQMWLEDVACPDGRLNKFNAVLANALAAAPPQPSPSSLPPYHHPVTIEDDCYDLPDQWPDFYRRVMVSPDSLPLLMRVVDGMSLADVEDVLISWAEACWGRSGALQMQSKRADSNAQGSINGAGGSAASSSSAMIASHPPAAVDDAEPNDHDWILPSGEHLFASAASSLTPAPRNGSSMSGHPNTVANRRTPRYPPYEKSGYAPEFICSDITGSICGMCGNATVHNPADPTARPRLCAGCGIEELLTPEQVQQLQATMHSKQQRGNAVTALPSDGSQSQQQPMQTEDEIIDAVWSSPLDLSESSSLPPALSINWFQDDADLPATNDTMYMHPQWNMYTALLKERRQQLPIVAAVLAKRAEQAAAQQQQQQDAHSDGGGGAGSTTAATSSSADIKPAASATKPPVHRALHLPDPMAAIAQGLVALPVAGMTFCPPTEAAVGDWDQPASDVNVYGQLHDATASASALHPAASTACPLPRSRLATDAESEVTLSTCLNLYTRESALSSDNLYSCPACNHKVAARQSTALTRAPEVLIIVLKRFVHLNDYGDMDKLDTLVHFPLQGLDLRPWLAKGASGSTAVAGGTSGARTIASGGAGGDTSADTGRGKGKGQSRGTSRSRQQDEADAMPSATPSSSSSESSGVDAGDPNCSSNTTATEGDVPPVYDLFAVCHHSGVLNAGHYTSYAANPVSGRWYHFNDDLVKSAMPNPTADVPETGTAAASANDGADTARFSSVVASPAAVSNPPQSDAARVAYSPQHLAQLSGKLVTPAAYLLFYRKRRPTAAE